MRRLDSLLFSSLSAAPAAAMWTEEDNTH